MPLYEYQCKSCGTFEEKLQGISAPQFHDCPNCGAEEGMRRQISTASFALTGTGWFAGGYGQEKGSKSPESVPSKPAEPGGCCGGCACH